MGVGVAGEGLGAYRLYLTEEGITRGDFHTGWGRTYGLRRGQGSGNDQAAIDICYVIVYIATYEPYSRPPFRR